MKRHWLLFSQVVTVMVAIWFVVATLKPEWVNRRAALAGVTLLEAASSAPGAVMPGSLSPAAKRAAPAVVSIATTQAKAANPQQNDPWFRFWVKQHCFVRDHAVHEVGDGRHHLETQHVLVQNVDDFGATVRYGRGG